VSAQPNGSPRRAMGYGESRFDGADNYGYTYGHNCSARPSGRARIETPCVEEDREPHSVISRMAGPLVKIRF